MKKLSQRFLCTLLVSWLPLWAYAQDTDVPPQSETIEGAVTHVFKSTPQGELRLHVFSPSDSVDAERRAAIVFFFGGGFRTGFVEQFIPQSQHLAERGMVAIVADYRVSGRHGTGRDEGMADGQSAIRWVRSHADELGIDPDRIATSGSSSGGVVALAAVLDTLDDPTEYGGESHTANAFVLFNPGTNMARPSLGVGLPPAVIYHGTEDAVIPYARAEEFCTEYQRLGNRCRLVGYEGAGHGFFNPDVEDGKWYRETLLETDRFLAGLGYLSGPSPEQVEWPVP